MQYTENYSLRKPQAAETASYQDLNYNSDKIDGIMADNRQISLSMYVSGNTYNTGDLVGYENPSTHHIRVYRCLVDNVTGVWDSTKWTLTNLADEILDAKASGGTEVEANPTGTPSDTLNTVDIDGVIYAVGGDSANQNIADAFSELQTYSVGDYCIYESILYKCTTAVQTAGAWDSTKWTSCVITDEMGSGGGGASSLADLDDVEITSPSEGQILRRNANGKWINTDMPDVDVTKTASGNPIDVSDSANAPLVKCVSAITGSQDLHGYDKPWVGGAGKNKWPFGDFTGPHTDVPYSLPAGTYTVSKLDDNTPAAIRFMGGGMSELVTFRSSTTFTLTEASTTINYSCDSGTATNVMIESGSTATAYEPYSNICPITAYTEGEIVESGRNLYPIKIGDDSFSPNAGGSASNDNGTLVVTATSTSYSGVYTALYSTFDNMTEELVGKFTYSFYAKSSVNLRAVLGITNYGRGEFDLTTTWQRISMTATFPGTKLALLIYSRGAAGTIYIKDFMVERGDTPHEYEEYIAPTIHATTYPSAIFRGSEDVVNGEVRTDYTTVDLGDLTFVLTQDGGFYTDSLKGIIKAVNYSQETTTAVCSCYIATTGSVAANRLLDGSFGLDGVGRIYFYDTTKVGKTATEIKADLTGQTLAYELATPTTSSVTPTNLPIRTLSPYTHIESSTGEMEIEYIAKEYQPFVDFIQSNQHVYSTQEQVVGKWIDGKDLYEITKTYTVPQLRVSDWTQLEDLSSLNIETLLPITGKMHNNNTGADNDAGYYLRFNYSNGNLNFYTAETSQSTGTITAILHYTKSSS